MTAECFFVVADAYVHLAGEPTNAGVAQPLYVRDLDVHLPTGCERPEVIASVVATDARFEIVNVVTKLHPTPRWLRFAVRYGDAAPTGRYVGTVVDCPDETIQIYIETALAKIDIKSPARRLLHAFINSSMLLCMDRMMSPMPTFEQLAYLNNFDKLLASPRDAGCSMIMMAAIVRGHLPTEAP